MYIHWGYNQAPMGLNKIKTIVQKPHTHPSVLLVKRGAFSRIEKRPSWSFSDLVFPGFQGIIETEH
jgi:hypothetical protein